MLTDIRLKFKDRDAFVGDSQGDDREVLSNCWQRLFSPEAVEARYEEPGIYHGVNLSNDIRRLSVSHDVVREYRSYDDIEKILEEPSWYGIADNLDQIKAHLKPFIEDPERCFLIEVSRSLQSEVQGQGWRWHKNGPYIGNQKPQCEYFGDEPEIDEVWHFHILEVEPK